MLNFLRRLTVRRRIIGGFLILVLFVMASIPMTAVNRTFLLDRLQQVGDEAGVDRLLLQASTRVASSRVNLMRYIQDYALSPYEALDDVDLASQLLLEAQNFSASPEQQEDIVFVLNALTEYKSLINEMTEARQKGDTQNASRLEFQTFKFGNDIGQRIEQIVKQSQARVEETNETVLVNTQTRLALVIVGYVVISILAVGLGLIVARSITQPIGELQRGAEAFRQGNLESVIPVAGADELTHLAQTFNQLSTQLSELYQGLEKRVTDRTLRLELVAALGERLTAILNVDQLLVELVNQVKISFDYYHAHIYIIDDERENLVMTAGYGEAGAQMKAAGHHIPLNAPQSLVARAARSGETAWVDNVREAEDWLPNPLLPNTYSEMAVPVTLEGQVIGVLDVQDDEIAGLDEGDANLLRSLANYVSVSVRNARLFAGVENALAEARAAQARYQEQAWDKTKIIASGGVHHYAAPGAAALDDETMIEAKQRAAAQDQAEVVETYGGSVRAIVAPVKLRDTTIGALQV
ncbi:MAG TPA: GAF domain-containing protein, partial [Chloroflexi bacterium]|nr:GAF domain-containing protein [Chloroflexota bacterium]